MDMQKIGTIVVGIIFLSSTVAYAMSFAFSNPQNQDIPDPVRGNKDAKVTIVEYNDYLCTYCRESHDTIKDVLSNYTDEVRLVFKSFPTSENSLNVARAAECAHMQNKFWSYHDKLFQTELPITNKNLKDIANEVGLDVNEFNQCLQLSSVRQEILKDRQEGLDRNIKESPTFFINDKEVAGNRPYSTFEDIIEENLG